MSPPHNSGFFPDMFSDSVPSSNMDNPLPIDDDSTDLKIMLLIITSKPREAISRVTTWKQAKTLYDMADKYQLDTHRPWFSIICRNNATQQPWEAIFLACNQSPMDTDLIHTAIADGFSQRSFEEICSTSYFAEIKKESSGTNCWSTLRTSNTTFAFGVKLGLFGLMAYNFTFRTIEHAPDTSPYGKGTGECRWQPWADKFVENVRAIEAKRSSSSPADQPVLEVKKDSATPMKDNQGGSPTTSLWPPAKICQAFNNPTDNIVIRTLDNVIFRVQDYYLQAAG